MTDPSPEMVERLAEKIWGVAGTPTEARCTRIAEYVLSFMLPAREALESIATGICMCRPQNMPKFVGTRKCNLCIATTALSALREVLGE